MRGVTFLGDISLNDWYVDAWRDGLQPFQGVVEELQNSQFVIGNLECLAEGDQGENKQKVPRLKTTKETLTFLKDINLSLVTLAHNHVYDNLEDGFEKTVGYLDEMGIQHIGAGATQEMASEGKIISIDGVTIGFLNYVTKNTNPHIPDEAAIKVNWYDLDKIQADISNLKKKVDQIVVLLHWGGDYEGGYYPNTVQSSEAREMIDYGADLIVGHHSHTLQPYEIYKGKYIFHSLGNFCFSNIPKYGYEVDRKKATHSIMLHIRFTKESYRVEKTPIQNNDGYIVIDQSILGKLEKRRRHYQTLKNSCLLWHHYHFTQKYIYPVGYYFFGNNRNPWSQLKKLQLQKVVYYFTR